MPKIYRGYRNPGAEDVRVLVDEHVLDPAPSQQLHNHSPAGFNWGYSGSGPAQLALAILFDATGEAELALTHYQDFKRQFVAQWEGTWQITEEEIRHWLSLERTVASPRH